MIAPFLALAVLKGVSRVIIAELAWCNYCVSPWINASIIGSVGLTDTLAYVAKRGVKINLFNHSLLNQLKYTTYAILNIKTKKWKF